MTDTNVHGTDSDTESPKRRQLFNGIFPVIFIEMDTVIICDIQFDLFKFRALASQTERTEVDVEDGDVV